MKVFYLTQKNLDTVGINPNQSIQPYQLTAKILIGFLILTSFFICSLVFVFFEAKTFNEYTQSIFMGSCAALIIFVLISTVFNMRKIFQLINDCENVVNTTLKYSASKSIFNETVQFERKLSGIIFFVMLKITTGFACIPLIIYNFFIYFAIDLGSAAFELPFPMWFPFDWKNPFGSLIAITVECMIFSYIIKIGACILTLGIGLYLYGIAMAKCIKQNLFAIDRNIRSKSERKLILEQFIEYIDFDARTKRLSNDTSNVYQHYITGLFLWSLVTICGALLMIQMQMLDHRDSWEVLLVTVFQVFYAFSFMFIACEMSQRSNIAFDECNDVIDQLDWYLLPAEIQRMLPFILHFAQQPVYINCFGSWPCNRETFKYVIKRAFSYFTVFRKFYN